MHLNQFIALAPLILLALTSAAVMLQIAIGRNHAATLALCLTGLSAAFASLPATGRWTPVGATPLLMVDPYALFYIGVILVAGAATALFAYGYLDRLGGHCEEFYLLLLIAVLGAAVLVTSRHFAAFFIGLEILSIALYALIAYPRQRVQSVASGLKYLVLAAVSSTFLLFGMALIYVNTGTLDFAGLAPGLSAAHGAVEGVILTGGAALLLVGIGFKLALVPFHMWTPDVYQGAPAPVTGFVATASKAAVAGLLVRLFAPVDLLHNQSLFRVFALVAFASMVGGNLLALRQRQVKRLLAYSSIAHMGYLMVAFLARGHMAMEAVAFYVAAYTITTLGAFGIISVFSRHDGDADNLEEFHGLFFQHPWLSGLFIAMLLSLAGIPLTVGFVGKFYLVAAALHGDLWWLVLTLLVTSGVSLFYYLRIVVALFSPAGESQKLVRLRPAVGISNGLALCAMAVLLVWMGIEPGPLLALIQKIIQ